MGCAGSSCRVPSCSPKFPSSVSWDKSSDRGWHLPTCCCQRCHREMQGFTPLVRNRHVWSLKLLPCHFRGTAAHCQPVGLRPGFWSRGGGGTAELGSSEKERGRSRVWLPQEGAMCPGRSDSDACKQCKESWPQGGDKPCSACSKGGKGQQPKKSITTSTSVVMEYREVRTDSMGKMNYLG